MRYFGCIQTTTNQYVRVYACVSFIIVRVCVRVRVFVKTCSVCLFFVSCWSNNVFRLHFSSVVKTNNQLNSEGKLGNYNLKEAKVHINRKQNTIKRINKAKVFFLSHFTDFYLPTSCTLFLRVY